MQAINLIKMHMYSACAFLNYVMLILTFKIVNVGAQLQIVMLYNTGR